MPAHHKARQQRVRDQAITGRDLRSLGWWLISQILAEDLTPQHASVAARIMGLLERLGPGLESGDESLRELALRGMVMAGVPPRTPDEWELAARIFDDAALAELRRWPALLERDRHEPLEPLILPEHGGGEGEMPPGCLVDDRR